MGNKESIEKHVEVATRTGVVQLVNRQLKEFPKELLKLDKQIRSLDLSKNTIKRLPPAISSFVSLKQLTIDSNVINRLPDELGLLVKLESLSLANNKIPELPLSISNLKALKKVNLSGNNLTTFPVSLFVLAPSLDWMDFSRNKIACLEDGRGESWSQLAAYEINLNQNQIGSITSDIASAPRLKVLRLEENCLPLASIPAKILLDSQISLLAVDGNLFQSKELMDYPGYEAYMERYTASKKKIY